MNRLNESDIWSPVLGLIILNHNLNNPITSQSKILLANRIPENNSIHPDVISTITMRLKHAWVSLWEVDSCLEDDSVIEWEVSNNPTIPLIQKAVQTAIDIKLWWIDRFTSYIQMRFGNIKTWIPVWSKENITMYSVMVHIAKATFPQETPHYSDIWWRNVGQYLNKENDVWKGECIWLCNATARTTLAINLDDPNFLKTIR